MAKTTIGTVTPAAIAAVLFFDCGIWVLIAAVAVGVVDVVDKAVFVAVVETGEDAGDGEFDGGLDLVVEDTIVVSADIILAL